MNHPSIEKPFSFARILWLTSWYLSGAALIVLTASILVGMSLKDFSDGNWKALLIYLGAWLLSIIWPSVSMLKKGSFSRIWPLLLSILIFISTYGCIAVIGLEYKIAIALSTLALTLLLITLPASGKTSPVKPILLIVISLGGWIYSLSEPGDALLRNAPPWISTEQEAGWTSYQLRPKSDKQFFRNTAFQTLRVREYPGSTEDKDVVGSGIALIGEQILISRGDGTLYLGQFSPNKGAISLIKLAYRIPLNKEAFKANLPNGENPDLFRVASIYVESNKNNLSLFAAHHWWNEKNRCYTLRLSLLKLKSDQLTELKPSHAWQTIYDSRPCLSIFENDASLFKGHEAGGRIVMFDDQNLLMTVGHAGFDGVNRQESHPQSNNADYGKTVLINKQSGISTIFTLGHRNSQGLYIDQQNNIWSTEHGPEGGDELNLLQQGNNYGWPLVTYGTDYFRHEWPLNKQQANHDGFEKPLYAWVPSIGISSLIRLEKDRFKTWQGNILIGSLKQETLYRVMLEENHIASIEPVHLGEHIRDLVELDNGDLLVQTKHGNLQLIEPVDSELNSYILFARKCGNCHSFIDDRNLIGPSLKSVAGRKIAANEEYKYSAAMKSKSGNWSRHNLDAFLQDPQGFSPGNKMSVPAIKNPQIRKKIVNFLYELD